MKKLSAFLFLIFCSINLFSQEALKSIEEEYYDFLSLQGLVERPTLGYRTLSDSVWELQEDQEHIWQNNNLGSTRILWESENQGNNWFTKGFYHGIKYKIYGPEWFNSYNTAAPYGQNDGALWQGRGYNTSLTSGIRAEGFGFEVTLKPMVVFSENKGFEIMPSGYSSPFGYIWSYGNNNGVDSPQRFGNSAFFDFDFSESEIRYSNNKLTLGFGTQSIWLGPALINPLLHSNNAASYPKIDFGIKKTNIVIPKININLGTIESRIWIGYLSESKYFDTDDSNNHNLINGFAIYISPSILPGLIIGANKVCLSKYDISSIKYLNPFYSKNNYGSNTLGEDQKISLTFEWLVPKGQISVYGELGIDDKPNVDLQLESVLTHYWHCSTYTFGITKGIDFSKTLKGKIIFEVNNTEMSQDMQFNWPYNFGFHDKITQGYTNKGQWLGSGIGYGGQSQYLAFKLYYPQGYSEVFIHRYNPDNNFLFKEAIYDVSTGESGDLHARTWNYFKTITSIGVNTNYYITPNTNIDLGVTYSLITNPLYNKTEMYKNWHNFTFILNIKYIF